jgi:flagellar biosynthesis/type III secretory pathway M-ring protein FliF/YscJ
MPVLVSPTPEPSNAIEALYLFAALTVILIVFVILIGIITARRRARIRREQIKAQRTQMADAWVESARRLTIVPSEIRRSGPKLPDDRDPPPHDDDEPDDPRGRWKPR